jgi:hypothetical protein
MTLPLPSTPFESATSDPVRIRPVKTSHRYVSTELDFSPSVRQRRDRQSLHASVPRPPFYAVWAVALGGFQLRHSRHSWNVVSMDQRCASHATICYGFIVISVVKNAHRDGSLYPHGHRPNGPHERFPHLVPVPRASDDLRCLSWFPHITPP